MSIVSHFNASIVTDSALHMGPTRKSDCRGDVKTPVLVVSSLIVIHSDNKNTLSKGTMLSLKG